MQLRRSQKLTRAVMTALTGALICSQPLVAQAEQSPAPSPTPRCVATADSQDVQLPGAALKVNGKISGCG